MENGMDGTDRRREENPRDEETGWREHDVVHYRFDADL
jgi:hypothetical protein